MEELRATVEPLREKIRGQTVYDKQVFDLVDPSMFPLIYGKTRVYADGRQIGLESYVQRCHEVSAAIPPLKEQEQLSIKLKWSLRFRWLPCEVKFSPKPGISVSTKSYINNLHPVYHKQLYGIVEKIMVPGIQKWNNCLFKGDSGPAPIRIRNYGFERRQPPEWLNTVSLTMLHFWESENPTLGPNPTDYEKFLVQIDEFLDSPDNLNDDGLNWIPEKVRQRIANRDRHMGPRPETCMNLCVLAHKKKDFLYAALHPEPGTAFSYEDWKEGRNGKAIIDSRAVVLDEATQQLQHIPNPEPDLDSGVYHVNLQDEFRAQGLQIIVRFRDIELTPSQPNFTNELALEAQRNEHIVATAAYIYSSSNIHLPEMSFHQPSWMHERDYDFREHFPDDLGLDDESIYPSMRAVFAFAQSAEAEHHISTTYDNHLFIPGMQTLGSIFLRAGRLLAWPNTLMHRLKTLSLRDNTQPGLLRMLLLYLVDPHYRIVSTANVPPQQHEWWADAAIEKGVFALPGGDKIPAEIRRMVDEKTEDWPMGNAEAMCIKEQVVRERAVALQAVIDEGMLGYVYDQEHWE